MFQVTAAPQNALVQKLVPIVTQACEILREEYAAYCAGSVFDINRKNDDSPVTQADFRVNGYIMKALAAISDLPVLSEEGEHAERKNWSSFWLLDPLDGTKEFLHKRPEFTINLSLVQGADTVFAVLAIPGEYSLYFCPEQGLPLKLHTQTGQWYEYCEDTSDRQIQVGVSQSSKDKPEYAEYMECLATLSDFEVLRAGSAYKFCMMLEDRVDIYPRFHPTCEWDTSAGQCLIERIGGGLVDFQGRSFVYNQRSTLLNKGFIAYRNLKMKKIAMEALHLMQQKH